MTYTGEVAAILHMLWCFDVLVELIKVEPTISLLVFTAGFDPILLFPYIFANAQRKLRVSLQRLTTSTDNGLYLDRT